MSQMTHKEFCCWLEGFFMRGGAEPTADQWHEIGKRLHKTMNPLREVRVGGIQDITCTVADYLERYGKTVPVPGPMKQDSGNAIKRRDECEQGERKKDSQPVKTIADMAREAMDPFKILKAGERMDFGEFGRLKSHGVEGMARYVPPFTPQAPFKGEGY